MSERTATRRTVPETVGAAATAASVPAAVSATKAEWTAVESPTGNTSYDVEHMAAGAYAVGAGGAILES